MNRLSRSLLAVALLAAAPAASAGGFSTTNVQLLQGYDFDDALYFTDGTMTTLTLNHFSTWEMGDSFFFVDLYRGGFKNFFAPGTPATGNSKVYAEWHPRLFLNPLLGLKEPTFGFIRNWGLAGEVNQSENYYAYLGGLGFDFVAPPGWVLGLNVFYRYDKFAEEQWQVSPYWTVPFSLGPVPFVFTGFVDVNGTKDFAGEDDVEVWAQPQLLVDVLGAAGGKKGKLLVGGEWFYHKHPAQTASVPQLMVQWTIF